MKKRFFAILALFAILLPLQAQDRPQGWPQGWPQGGQQQRPQGWQRPQGGQQQQHAQNGQQQQRPQGWQQGNNQQRPQQPAFDPQEFTKRMEGYIAMKAGLTREESDKFFPIYREFKEKQRDLTAKQQQLKRKKPANDKDYENALAQIANLSVQIAKLEQTYVPRMCKAIPAKKVFIALQAETDFHRDLVRQPLQWGGQQPQWGGQQQRPNINQPWRSGNNNQQKK